MKFSKYNIIIHKQKKNEKKNEKAGIEYETLKWLVGKNDLWSEIHF